MKKVRKLPKDETKKEAFEKIRSKNRQLIKEVKRLRRLKSRSSIDETDSWDDELTSDSTEGVAKDGITICPKCKDNSLKIVELRGLPYGFCSNVECDFKGRLNK